MKSRYDRFVGFLYSHPAMRAGNFEDVVRLTTETAVRALRVSRAEIRLLRDGRLEDGDAFSRETASHVCLSPVGVIGDERLPEDRAGVPGGETRGTSRVFFAIRGDGAPVGLLGIVRDGGRPWTDRETSFCVSLAGLVGLAFEIAVRREANSFDRNRAIPSMTFRYSPGTLEFEPAAPEGCLELTGYSMSAFLQDRELFFRAIVSPADLAKFTSMERTKSGRLQADILFSGERKDGASRRFRFRGCRAKDDVGGVPVIEGAMEDVTHLYAQDRAAEDERAAAPEQSLLPENGRIDMLLLRSPGGEDPPVRDLRRAVEILLSPADGSEKDATARGDGEICGYDVLPWLYGILDAVYLRAMERKVRFLANIAPDIPRRLIGNRAGMRRIVSGLLDGFVRLTSGESVLFEVDGESTGEGYRLHFGIAGTGADDRANLSAVFSAGRRLFERLGGEMCAERDAGPGFVVRCIAPPQNGEREASALAGVASGKNLLVLHESPILLNHLKDLCCGLGVQSRFCATWTEFERVLVGGRFTHALCSVRAEEDIARLGLLRGRQAERGELFYRFSVCADVGAIAQKIPSDVVLLLEPLLPEAIARFLCGEYYCAREPDASVVSTLSLPLPAIVVPERPGNDLLKRLRTLEFLRADKALQRLANDADLYISLLEAFRRDISRSCDALLGAMQREDRRALALECHTMKISLRTIGAESLGEEAERLEMEENNGGAEQKLYFSFIASLEKLSSGLDAVFKTFSGASLSESDLQDRLRDFREALSLFDIQRLRSLADEIASGVGERNEARVMELRKCLDLLDYEAAEKILQELVTQKGPSWRRN